MSLYRTDVLAADLVSSKNESSTFEPLYRDSMTRQWKKRSWPVALLPHDVSGSKVKYDDSHDMNALVVPYTSRRRDFACLHLLAAVLVQHINLDHTLRQVATAARELQLHRLSAESKHMHM